ncbi:MAG: HD domain-containing protein [Deltaproteobacteria bacterium]|jgi:HD-GYP domain-containing protein (c-di-GMP phosphodiesterase class II)|nr:HD domain-containing protein [Deltaproteobacteria bacterium]
MPDYEKFSTNSSINSLIEKILDELCPFLEEQAEEISQLTSIGKALGSRKDISELLEIILTIARRFTKADGGTLYLVDNKNQNLNFHVIHNATLKLKKTGRAINLPGVLLYNKDNTPNLSNVSSYVFHTGQIVNIDNVYKTKKFQFRGTRKFDAALHYKSQSMIVIPMRNHENDIIGILQLINSIDPFSGKTVSFTLNDQEKASALASHASVLLTQQNLILEMKELFEAFIKAIAVSIDEKSKHTSGHIQRVTELCLMIGRAINEDTTIYKNTSLDPDQIDELRIAALMHDTGKITTPDHIINKSSRLELFHDRIELIKTRWDLFKTNQRLAAAQKKLALLDQTQSKKQLARIDDRCNEKIDELEKEFDTLTCINSTKGSLDIALIDQLKKIYAKSDLINNKKESYLNDDEFENLSVLKGTLTQQERDIINSHAGLSQKILSKLPWPKKLANIPSIAGAHHEKLDGSGYPLHLKKENLNLQARILAIADIFEALSALDRPYKKPKTLNQTIKVLEQMGQSKLLDSDIIKIFFKSETHLEYAKAYMSPWQIDI